MICHVISLYENTVILIKWINMKTKKRTPYYIPALPLPSKKDKNRLFEVRFTCLPHMSRQVYFSRTCGIFSNSLLPAEGEDA